MFCLSETSDSPKLLTGPIDSSSGCPNIIPCTASKSDIKLESGLLFGTLGPFGQATVIVH